MPKIALQGGTYEARSIIANLQRCLNLYPEKNPEDAESPYTYYPVPGLTLLDDGPTEAPWRALYRATDNKLFGVIGNKLYQITSSYTYTLVGEIGTIKGDVSMVDNGIYLVLVDGDAIYTVETADFSTFAEHSETRRATRVDYLDSYLIFTRRNSQEFFISESNSITIQPLDFASKTAQSDELAAAVVVNRELWLMGNETTEVWTNVGASDFPFQIISGMFIPHGVHAKNSIARHGGDVFWMTKGRDGQATIAMGTSGNTAKRISTRAVEEAFSGYSRLNDAIGFTYMVRGHVFYMLTFPTQDVTWVYDRTEELWHEESWGDTNGVEHRHRAGAIAFADNRIVVGDHKNGKLYWMDMDNYTFNGDPVKRLRTFPHLLNDGKRISYSRFIANMEVGRITDRSANPYISLRWSDTRGASWNDAMIQSLGLTGEYYTSVLWNRLGIARDRVFELSWSGPMQTALNGAFVEVEPVES
jgi:hypothetical protein